MPPWKRGHIVLQLSVGRSVCRSVRRPSVVRSISFDPFTWSIPNLVQALPSMSRWSLLIFRSHVQRSRSNHCVVYFVYFNSLLTCFYREDKPEFCTMGDIFVSETFLVLINLRLDYLWNFRLLCMVWQTIHGLELINIRKYNSLI